MEGQRGDDAQAPLCIARIITVIVVKDNHYQKSKLGMKKV
jgi:hypothetical protein